MTPFADSAFKDSDCIADETGDAYIGFEAIIEAYQAQCAMLQVFSLLRGDEDTVGRTPGLGYPSAPYDRPLRFSRHPEMAGSVPGSAAALLPPDAKRRQHLGHAGGDGPPVRAAPRQLRD